MWVYNNDFKKWEKSNDSMLKSDFDYLKQELSATRFYSKFLSGSTYVPISDVNDIYDILGKWVPRNWYIGTLDSKYSISDVPARFSKIIDNSTSYEYYTKFISEYGLTLKNLFTSARIIKDSIDNYIPVYVATTTSIDLNLVYSSLTIDGIVLKSGNLVLVKDQVTNISLSNTTDPDVYLNSNYKIINDLGTLIEYQYYSYENGIYLYDGRTLIKQNDLSDYKKCIRMSVYVEAGTINSGKQFHLSRLLNGYFPTSLVSDGVEFKEKKNWLLRNRVDYNNLFEINYFDVIKEGTHSYHSNGITYSIPERTISVGEFGVISNTQFGTSNIVPNKYKVNLRSISKTTTDYWICGDDTTILKVRKHDFDITLVKIDSLVKLSSISFFNDLRGVVVGDLNTILLTTDAGQTWNRLKIDDFASFTYNKVLFSDFNRIYIVGRNGIFLEIVETINGWTAYRRRISKQIDEDDEYLLVENINDMYLTTINNWNLSYSYNNKTTSVNKELLFFVTDNNNIIAHDINNSTDYDFLYLDLGKDYGDILNITKKTSSDIFYFTSNDGLYSFDLNKFQNIGIGNSYSNAISGTYATYNSGLYANEIFDYKGEDLLLAGNTSLLKSATYSSNLNFKVLDSNFESRLKPKLLFMDYDMGSKLNFFTDQGEYRLPNSATFSLIDTSASTILTYSSGTVNLAINDNTLLISPINITIDPSTKIEASDLRVKLNITHAELYSISISLRKASNPGKDKIITLMPNNVAGPNADFVNFTFTTNPYYSKFSNLLYPYSNKTASILTNTDNSGNFYSAFIDVANANAIVYANSSDFSEMIKLPNGSYDIAGDWELLIYDWANNGLTRKLNSWEISFVKDNSTFSISPIVHSATGPSYLTQSEVNWWNYWSDREKTFEYWTTNTISDSSAILHNSTFTSYDSYSSIFPKELSINRIDTSDTELLKLAPSFKYSGSKNSSRFDSNLGPQILTNIVPPNVSGTNRMYLKDYLMILEIDTRWSVDKGDVIRLESDIIDNNFIVNKIVTSQALFSPASLGNRKFVYMYSEFNENIINELVVLSKSGGSIKVRNLNKYNSIDNLISNFNYHPLSNAYYATQSSGIISVNPKFNPITSYYNLGTSVNFNGLTSSMSYADSFLKFGYSPRYNLLDYLEAINTNLTNPSFYATKEYLAMPVYKGLPIATDSLNADNVYIDKSGLNAIDGGTASVVNDYGNRLVLGPNLKLEWESIFVNTFVDVSIYHAGSTNGTYSVNKLLVLNKYKAINYKDSGIDPYIIEFDKSIKFDKGKIFATGSTVDIVSRRTLKQISDDLQELNNIQRPKSKIAKMDGVITSTYSNYDSDLNFKLSTDSYAKVLLSDVNTVKELSAIMYTDYKNEIAMNVTRLDRSYSIPISNTIDYYGQLYINCSEKHGLVLADGLVLEFNGGTFSSEYLNQQYFGYHFVKQVINEYDFVVEIPYGNPVYIGNDTGFVKYMRKDSFFNYQPVDLIEVGLNKKGNVAIKLDPDNVKLTGSTFSLTNVDYNRYRYRLLDGLTFDSVGLNFPWLLEAEVTDAIVGLKDYTELIWYKGIWESGRWFGGTWVSGTWKYGDWYGGTWNSQNVVDKGQSVDVDINSSGTTQSVWFTGRWYDGTWNDGTWVNGRWYDGTWERGTWNNGIWNDGTWNYGRFIGGIWVTGTWNDGIFNTDNEQSFWINGEWNGGDFENGIWYNGFFGEDNSSSRFGTNAYNSRTAIWYGGKWKSGSFYSKLTNNDVSDVHKYSIWYSGQWMSGDFRGGIAYNMDFNSGTWHGGILEEIQLIGINSSNNSFILNGLFKFNIGDEIYIIDNNLTNEYSKYGSNTLPGKYTVLYVVENTTTRLTEVYVDMNIDTTNLASYKKNSGLLNLSIPNNSTQIISTQSIPYDVNTTNEIRVKLNLSNNYISDLIINLKAPNGDIINIKEYGAGGSQYLTTPSGVASPSPYTSMVDTIFTTDTSNDFKFGSFLSSTYTETYEMSKAINQGYLKYQSSTNDYRVLLSNGSVKGDWVLYVKDNHKNLTNQIGSTGLMHSSNYAIHLTYVNIGDNFKIVLQKPNSYNPDLRIGDNIVIDIIGHSPASNLISANSNTAPVLYTLSTYISGISNINTGTMHITTGLTASTVISSYFSGSSGLLPPAGSIYSRSYANIYSSSNPRPENKLIDWEIQFVNDYEVGAQIDYKKEDGFDTSLRVVSKFKNVNWKSGIWTNGIYDNGVFEGGVWYNGVFNGTWG